MKDLIMRMMMDCDKETSNVYSSPENSPCSSIDELATHICKYFKAQSAHKEGLNVSKTV